MRALQLGLGWLALCGFTAAGTYYAVIELDRQVNLQARLCPTCAAGAAASATQPLPDPRAPVQTPPGPVTPPGQARTPPAQPVITPPPQQQPVTQPPQQGGTPPPQQAVVQPPPRQVTPPPQQGVQPPPRQQYPAPQPYQPPQQPPQQQAPIYRPPSDAPTRADMGLLTGRLSALADRARSVNVFFTQMESTLQQQGQSLRSDIRAARGSMQQYLNEAAVAIRSGNSAAASQKLDLAEEKIIFLEQAK